MDKLSRKALSKPYLGKGTLNESPVASLAPEQQRFALTAATAERNGSAT